MADYETILVDRKNDVVIVTLNRPHKKNAMNPKLHHEMVELLGALRYDKDLRVLVITGKGDSFSAGEDLKEFFLRAAGAVGSSTANGRRRSVWSPTRCLGLCWKKKWKGS
jgi:enoyl-CoA hydratase/carnithine racemase